MASNKRRPKIHDWDTVEDYVLLEDIRDILSDVPSPEQNENKSYSHNEHSDNMKHYIYSCFNASTDPRIQRRIDYIMSEIHKQDTLKGIEHSSKGSKDLSKTYDHDIMDSDYKKVQDPETLTKTELYNSVKDNYQKEMGTLLQKKTKDDLKTEVSMDKCTVTENVIFDKCESLKRINLILCTYHGIMNNPELWRKVPLAPILCIGDRYNHQQMLDDFLHIKLYHITLDEEKQTTDINANMAKKICEEFEKKYKCADIEKCHAFRRHYRDRTDVVKEKEMFYSAESIENKSEKIREMVNDIDKIFQEECDKIHCYFLHSTIQFSNEQDDVDDIAKANDLIDGINEIGLGRSWAQKTDNSEEKKVNPKKAYLGQREDENWLKHFDQDKKEPEANAAGEEGYKLLMENMGVFRWQSSHGFRTGQNRGLMHLKAKFKNIKEEALYNIYCPASKDNWNQTLRKSKLFFQSFARQRLRTKYAGSFEDEVSNLHRYWKAGETTGLEDIVTLKLYTDFDKLQHELKKCFRWESIVALLNKHDAKTTEKQEKHMIVSQHDDDKARNDLENRLREFFHWRISLLTVLTKFGIKINEKNMELYHGVNAKMILNPSETMAFYGPLSTTSSYHVAKTFATAKGMVLKITSQYPRLDYCRAFDASLISDYPEEQEYLISFVYMRVLEVRTRPIVRDPRDKNLWIKAPLASKIRVVFFAIHLFREQIFSMSRHLEYYLIEFLKCNRMDCCQNHQITALDKVKSVSFLSWFCCRVAQHPKALTNMAHWDGNKLDDKRNKRIMRILWDKFSLFRNTPNLKQIIKIDEISDGLKQFFLEKVQNNVKGKDKYVVSFNNLLEVFPNIEEVHYINNYRFDDDILQKLLDLLKEEKEKKERHEEEREIKSHKPHKSASQILAQNKWLFVSDSSNALDPDDEVVINDDHNIAVDDMNEDHDVVSDSIDKDPEVRIMIKLEPPSSITFANLNKMVFLYYNYIDAIHPITGEAMGYPADDDKFFHPKSLNADKKQELENYGWVIKYGPNGNVGFKIRVYEKEAQDHAKGWASFVRTQTH